jgi:hypothetical protein
LFVSEHESTAAPHAGHPAPTHFGQSFGTARAEWMSPANGRQIMARFEFIAFGFCATFTALLTIATLSPIA